MAEEENEECIDYLQVKRRTIRECRRVSVGKRKVRFSPKYGRIILDDII